jgi:hypothetical protein
MNYEFIGWCKEDNHDKVWGVIKLRENDNTVCVFWGRRGKKLQTKVSSETYRDMYRLIDSKTRKGYQKVSKEKLNEVYPEFQTDLEQTAFWATLSL